MQNATVEAIVHYTYLHGPDVDGIWQVGHQMIVIEWLSLDLLRLLTILHSLRTPFCQALRETS